MDKDAKNAAGAGVGDKPQRIEAKDVASATAVGAATRLGVGRHKAKVAEAAAGGVGARSRRSSDRSKLLTAVLVAGIMFGMLAVMIVFNR